MRDFVVDCLRAIISLSLYGLIGRKRVRILIYHKVCDLPPNKYHDHAVPPASFARQMEYLFRNKYNVITLEEFVEYKERKAKPPPKSVIITFDDGYMENYLNALPVLERYNFKATFFITSDYIDSEEPFRWLDWDEQLLSQFRENKSDWLPLSRQMLLDISERGYSVGSHTKSHPDLTQVEESVAVEELKGSKQRLEEILAKPVTSFSYPFGEELNERVKDLVKAAGYKVAVRAMGTGSTLDSDFFELGRMPIEGCDSFLRFKNKLRGAYDWERYRLSFQQFLGRVLSFRRKL